VLVCELVALAMNILRNSAMRRCIKTVMQELIYRSGRLTERGRRLIQYACQRPRVTDSGFTSQRL
jgi:hypothetical protein